MDFKRILWAYDGSDESEYALQYAILFARLFNGRIFGININTITDPKYGHYPHYAYFIEKAAKQHDSEFTEKFKKINGELVHEKIDFNSEIARGYADTEICNSIEKNSIDLAVMGITGRGILGRMLLGSTTSKVLEKVDVPVLAVRKKDEIQELQINKILVPMDISEEFDSAISMAYSLAVCLECNITLLHVINVGANLYEFPSDLIDKIVSGSREELKKIVDKVKAEYEGKSTYTPQLLPKVIFGMNSGTKIADYATRNSFDLIVMNKHRKRSFKKLILGSVTNQVISSSKCAVLAMKP